MSPQRTGSAGILRRPPGVTSIGRVRDVLAALALAAVSTLTPVATARPAVAAGVIAASDPAIVAQGSTVIHLFVRGADGMLWHSPWTGSGHQPFQSLGGPVQGGPAVASLGPGHLDVFVRGMNNALIHKFFASGRWSGWSQLGNDLTADPGATSNTSWTQPGNQMRLFARGGDGALYQRAWSRQTEWTPWNSAGYRPNGGPDAAEAGTLIVVVRGADNAIYYKEGYGSTGWRKWPYSGP